MRKDFVGPILVSGECGDAVLAAIRDLNPEVETIERGSYVRVEAPNRCFVTRAAIEKRLGREFRLPSDLEQVMPSFVGGLAISAEEATWEWGAAR